jgi:hypothetical protein
MSFLFVLPKNSPIIFVVITPTTVCNTIPNNYECSCGLGSRPCFHGTDKVPAPFISQQFEDIAIEPDQWATLAAEVKFAADTELPLDIHDVVRLPGCDVIEKPCCPLAKYSVTVNID